MKKKISALILTLLLVMTGCNSTQSEFSQKDSSAGSKINSQTESSQPGSLSSSPANAEDTAHTDPVSVTEVFPVTAEGNGVGGKIQRLLPIEGAELPDTDGTKIYKNPYPLDSAGLAKFTLTEEEKKEIAANLDEFLSTYYEMPLGSFLDQIVYEQDEMMSRTATYGKWEDESHAVVWPDYLRYFSHSEGKLETVAESRDIDGVLSHPLVKTALQYVGIENPQVTDLTEPNLQGKITEFVFKIIEATDDFSENLYRSSFQYVLVKASPAPYHSVIVETSRFDPEETDLTNAVQFRQALSHLQEKYPEEMDATVQCEAYYDSTIDPGYYIPCYRFVGESGAERYVAMVDLSESKLSGISTAEEKGTEK